MPVGPANLLALAAALLLGAAQPSGAAPPITPEQLDALVAELGSDDAITRVNAGLTLAGGVATLEQLERVLLRDDLSAEQRYRLMAAAYLCFGSEPRAAMGVSFGNAPNRQGVYIGHTEPGFDANRKLRPGDRIDSIDGARVEDADHGIALIQSRTPGEVIPLGIERNGQMLEVSLTLGSRETLGNASALKESAWLLRSAKYAGRLRDADRIIDSGLPPQAWSFAPGEPDRAETPRGYEPLRVVAGGEARAFEPAAVQVRPPTRITTNRVAPNQPLDVALEQERLRVLRALKAGESAKERNFLARLESPNLNERQRRELEDMLGRCRLSLQALDAQIRFIEDRLRGR